VPTHIRASIAWQVDSLLPRDAATINPCFRHQLGIIAGGPDWQTLADDLAAAVNTWFPAASRQLTVKLYEIKPPVAGTPNRPEATKVLNTGAFSPTGYPGEIACCLSFYGGSNSPHQRGRLYVPAFTFLSGGANSNRPGSADRTKVSGLVAPFANLGGPNVDWIVWSPTRQSATRVDHWFVDDEWDIQRRRGLKPTTRLSGTTSG